MALIPDEDLSTVHGLIGRQLLLRMTSEDQIDNYVFEICNQLNKARDNLGPNECSQLIELNLRAGRKTLKAPAFNGEMEYFSIARDLLGVNSWQIRRSLTLDVYLANVERLFAEAQYQQGNQIEDGTDSSY
jgi:predicted ATPase